MLGATLVRREVIAAFVRHPEDLRKVEAHGRRVFQRVDLCATFDELIDRFSAPALSAVVADLDMCPRKFDGRLLPLGKAPASVAVHAVHLLSEGETHSLRALAAIDPTCRSVYRRYHDIDACLPEHPLVYVPSATVSILAKVCARLPASTAHVFTCCVVLGERRTTIMRVAAETGISVKRLQMLLAIGGYPSVGRLLQIVRSAHAIYRMEVHGCEQGVAAVLGGFGSARSLENYAKKHLGLTAHQFVARHGFRGMLRMLGTEAK
jgi:hypothetical protein